jgi:hypothetical protein
LHDEKKGIVELEYLIPLTSEDKTRFRAQFNSTNNKFRLSFAIDSLDNGECRTDKIWLLSDDLVEDDCLSWVNDAISGYVVCDKVKDVYIPLFVKAIIASVESYSKITNGNTRSITFVDGEAGEIYDAAPSSLLAATVKDFVGVAKDDITVSMDLSGEVIVDIKEAYNSWGKDIGIVDHLYQMFHVQIP